MELNNELMEIVLRLHPDANMERVVEMAIAMVLLEYQSDKLTDTEKSFLINL